MRVLVALLLALSVVACASVPVGGEVTYIAPDNTIITVTSKPCTSPPVLDMLAAMGVAPEIVELFKHADLKALDGKLYAGCAAKDPEADEAEGHFLIDQFGNMGMITKVKPEGVGV